MARGLFLIPYSYEDGHYPLSRRYIPLRDVPAVNAWVGEEILGDYALCMVNAPAAALLVIAGTPRVLQIPFAALDDPVSSIPALQRQAVLNKMNALGYTAAEMQARFPNILNATIAQVLIFLMERRSIPRYDSAAQAVVFDGGQFNKSVVVNAILGKLRAV